MTILLCNAHERMRKKEGALTEEANLRLNPKIHLHCVQGSGGHFPPAELQQATRTKPK